MFVIRQLKPISYSRCADNFNLPIAVLACSLLFAFRACAFPAEEVILLQAEAFSSTEEAASDGWTQWSQREETAPEFFAAGQPSLGRPGSLGQCQPVKQLA